MKIIKILAYSFFISIFLIGSVLAVDLTPGAPTDEEEISTRNRPILRPFRNLAAYMTTFIDVDSNLRFLTDDLLLTNQCKKRDIFAIHERNDQISKQLIAEYTTMDADTLKELEDEYATLNLELKFLRNINFLSQENGEQRLKDYLLKKSKNNQRSLLNSRFDTFLVKYKESLNEYQNCRNSWYAVKEKVDNIKRNATSIQKDYAKLKETWKALKEEVLATPKGFYENSLETALIGGIKNSASTTWGNFMSEMGDIGTALERLTINPENTTLAVLKSIEGRRTMSVEEIIANENNLLNIVQSIRNQEATSDLNTEIELLLTELSISNNFNDNVNLTLFGKMLLANTAIQETERTFSSTQTGLNDQARAIYRLQCR